MEKNNKKEWKKPQVIDFDVDKTNNTAASGFATDGNGTTPNYTSS